MERREVLNVTKDRAIAKARQQAGKTGERRWVVLDPDPEKDQDETNGFQVADSMDMATIYADIDPKHIVFEVDEETAR